MVAFGSRAANARSMRARQDLSCASNASGVAAAARVSAAWFTRVLLLLDASNQCGCVAGRRSALSRLGSFTSLIGIATAAAYLGAAPYKMGISSAKGPVTRGPRGDAFSALRG